MAELVDALVSNTSGAIRAGSIPALGTKGKIKYLIVEYLIFFCFKMFPIRFQWFCEKFLGAIDIKSII